MNPTRESRPSAANAETALSNSAATFKLDSECTDSVATMSGERWAECMCWYSSGYARGIERGRELANAEAARLWREAAKVVRGLAGRDALPGTEWMQSATDEQLTHAAEQRRADDIARFRAAHAADRSAYIAGGVR